MTAKGNKTRNNNITNYKNKNTNNATVTEVPVEFYVAGAVLCGAFEPYRSPTGALLGLQTMPLRGLTV